METTYEVGNLVKIKSGGPLMTIVDLNEEGVLVVWFVGDELKQAGFKRACIVKAE